MESDKHDGAQDSAQGSEHESESDRRAFNIFLVAFFVVIVGTGVWLANAMIDARKADDCLSAGRRNCAPIEIPPR